MAARRVSWRELRPHWGWYFVVPALALLGVIVAIGLFVAAIGGAVGQFEEFGAPGSVTVELEEGDRRGIYAADAFRSSGDCSVLGPGERRIPLEGVTGSFEVNEYDAVSQFEARAGGAYRVTCAGTGAVAVGPEPDVFGLIGSIFGIFGAALGGFLLALAAWLLIFFLRFADRRRRERGGQPPPGPLSYQSPPEQPPPDFMNAPR